MTGTRWLRLCLLGLVLGCSGEGAPIGGDSIVADVDGVLHVTLDALPPAAASPLESRPVFSTGGDLELFHVTGARLLGGGSLAIANAGTSEIVILDPSGAVARRLGGKGEGPGEFQWISTLDVDTAGNLVAYDPRLGRLARMAPDGGGVESRRFAPPNRVVDLLPLATLVDGRIAAVYGQMRMFRASGEARDTIPLMVFDPEGTRADTLGMWPATEWAFIPFAQGSSRSQVGFGGEAVYTGRNGRFAIGSTDTLDIAVYGSDGLPVMRIGGGGPRAEVEEADVERWRQELHEIRSQAPEDVRRAADAPRRDRYPAFAGLVLDDARRLWIGAYARPTASGRTWVVIGADGSVQGTLDLPKSALVLDIAGDRIAFLDRSELDEEYVSVLALSR